MSLPPLNPSSTAAGIQLDPHTLERIIPESKRPDGTQVSLLSLQFLPVLIPISVRKQIKIRPGFTPQEDVRRFRGTDQVAGPHSPHLI